MKPDVPTPKMAWEVEYGRRVLDMAANVCCRGCADNIKVEKAESHHGVKQGWLHVRSDGSKFPCAAGNIRNLKERDWS